MFNMRASSFLIFFILTFVLFFFAEAVPKTSLQKSKDSSNSIDSEKTAEPAQFDSLAIPELNKYQSQNFSELTSPPIQKEKYLFFPTLGLYTGPTATQDATTGLTIGLNFNKLIEDAETIRFGFALTTTGDLFLNVSNQFTLAPQTWGNPYYNININIATDSADFLSSLVNVRNFSVGGAYGIRFSNAWSLEGFVGILNLKGTAVGINAIYSLAL
jgi:hypothetical protein